jgi:S-adenosylmethionine uptake transporter
MLPWIFKDGFKYLYTTKFKLHFFRGFFSIGGSLAFMYALQHVEMVDATALGYLEQVMLVITGMIYFKEKVTKSKLFAIFASFFGALAIVYPDLIRFDDSWVPTLFLKKEFNSFNNFYLFVLLAVFFWSSNNIVIKFLGKTEKTKTQLFYVMMFSCLFSYPLAFIKWKTTNALGLTLLVPDYVIGFHQIGLQPEHIKYIALLALCYFIHGIAFFKALKYSEMSTVIPFEYSRLVFIGILGYYLFAEVPSTNSYIGYALIVGSGLLLIKSEAKRNKKEKLAQKARELEEECGHA